MQTMQLKDINLLDLGHTIQIAGVVWTGNGEAFITTVPGKDDDFSNLKHMPLSLTAWTSVLRQVDLLETEIFSQDPSGLIKILVRKTQRQIDTYMQWAVFKRDHYRCRYCGREGIPLTVDHIDLWENGGITSEENLLTACRNCNKNRGRLEYDVWLKSPYYQKVSKNLSKTDLLLNEMIVDRLQELRQKRMLHVRSR